ncbi:GrpB family protein [Methylogaea oryzae]|uniref:GrpB family protein n=1 Tax=Methylogaea oryzae TaxID=1295382 RepID=UPI0006D151CB|nr:GrpB family protein [Methylogaea oryzae]
MKVVVSPYDPAWEAHFERHRAIIRSALSRLEPSIDHIGSTALKSIGAKPIIDILVGLPATVSLDGAVTPLLAGGYATFKNSTPPCLTGAFSPSWKT